MKAHGPALLQPPLGRTSPLVQEMKRLNVSETRRRLPELVGEVAATGEAVIITRRGKPLAKLVRFVALRDAERLPLRGTPLRMADDFDTPVDDWEAFRDGRP